jgi:hypothetical protein
MGTFTLRKKHHLVVALPLAAAVVVTELRDLHV